MPASLEQDRTEILKVHQDWWEANMGLRIPLMATCFPTGTNYLMFNLNGHPYFGIDEKKKTSSTSPSSQNPSRVCRSAERRFRTMVRRSAGPRA